MLFFFVKKQVNVILGKIKLVVIRSKSNVSIYIFFFVMFEIRASDLIYIMHYPYQLF